MKPLRFQFFFLIAFFCVSAVFGQEDNAFGLIIYADGDSFSIYRDGEYINYDIFSDDVLGLPLFQGDLVQTAESSFLEIQLLPSKNLVKIAGNTSFKIDSLSEDGGAGINLSYGRVRSKVRRLFGTEPFSVRGQSVVAGVRGTDFGFDYLVIPKTGSSRPSVRVYCFEGEVEIFSETEQVLSEPLRIVEGQMISLVSAEEEVDKVYSKEDIEAVSTAIRTYWELNDFISSYIETDEVLDLYPRLYDILPARYLGLVAKEKEVEVEKEELEVPEGEDLDLAPEEEGLSNGAKRNLQVLGGSLFTIGVLAEGAGMLLLFGDSLFPGVGLPYDQNTGIILSISGGAFIVSGLISLIAGTP